MEAHASDEWPIGSRYDYDQPKTLEARRAVAEDFRKAVNWEIPMVLDEMGDLNTFEHMYHAWPLRWYIIHTDGTLVYKAQPNGAEYKWEDVVDFMETLREDTTTTTA
jgi:hypothetical protein